MITCRLPFSVRFMLLALISLPACGHLRANTLLQDKGIFLAGPFPVPDIHQPPSASAEAVFLAGSVANAPLFFNQFLIDGATPQGQFSNDGWVNGSAFHVDVINNGGSAWVSWDFSGTHYALTYISVNFDNTFYHVYGTDPLAKSEGAVFITGNNLDPISHIHFFGVSTVPESGSSAVMLLMAVLGVAMLHRRLLSKQA
ncbi:MAG: hypothetical protein JO354_14805 [Verrucomicrobia bacterium]|nr:hypothetical protein [Verrucomicrobiota bacterium]